MLFTKRLKLRMFVESDKDAVVTLLKNADFMAYSPTGAMNHTHLCFRHNALKKYGFLYKFCYRV